MPTQGWASCHHPFVQKRPTFAIRGDHIELQQLLKAFGVVDQGAQAKELIQNRRILVNGRVETRRSKKLSPGDVIQWAGGSVLLMEDPDLAAG